MSNAHAVSAIDVLRHAQDEPMIQSASPESSASEEVADTYKGPQSFGPKVASQGVPRDNSGANLRSNVPQRRDGSVPQKRSADRADLTPRASSRGSNVRSANSPHRQVSVRPSVARQRTNLYCIDDADTYDRPGTGRCRDRAHLNQTAEVAAHGRRRGSMLREHYLTRGASTTPAASRDMIDFPRSWHEYGPYERLHGHDPLPSRSGLDNLLPESHGSEGSTVSSQGVPQRNPPPFPNWFRRRPGEPEFDPRHQRGPHNR